MKKIFLTGATGFLGGELLVLLSKNIDISHIFCLVRADDEEEAMKRLRKQFELHGDFFPEDKIIPVVGNLVDSTLPEKLSEISVLAEIDTVIHSAADTHFMTSKLMERVNIAGAKAIAHWAVQLKNLDTFVYVGTATICGKEITDRIVSEGESPNPNVEHMVKYTKTKMLAEMAMREIIPQGKLLVVRPSSVMGDSRDIKPRDFAILWVLIAINELRLVPSRDDAWIELLGVDYVAKAIEALLFAKRKYDTYHISAGPESITTLKQLAETMQKLEKQDRPAFHFIGREGMTALKQQAREISRGSRIERGEYGEFTTYWKKNFGTNGNLRIILNCLDDYLRFADQGVAFDNSRLLEDTGVGHPIPAHEYLVNNWPFMQKIDVMDWALNS